MTVSVVRLDADGDKLRYTCHECRVTIWQGDYAWLPDKPASKIYCRECWANAQSRDLQEWALMYSGELERALRLADSPLAGSDPP